MRSNYGSRSGDCLEMETVRKLQRSGSFAELGNDQDIDIMERAEKRG